MSTTHPPDVLPEDGLSTLPAGGSLRDRLAARRRQLAERDFFTQPILGYEDLGLYARYEVLDFTTRSKIGQRHATAISRKETEIGGTRDAAADTLAQACVGLLEKVGEDGGFRELAPGFTADAIREYIVPDLPEGATVRQAILAMFPAPHDGLVADMLTDYAERCSQIDPDHDEEMAGE